MYRLLPFLILLLSTPMLAQQEPLKVNFNTLTEVTEDGEFEVEVRLADFEGIYSMQMFFLWDSTVIRVNSVTEFSEDIPDFDDTMVTLPEQDNARPEKGKLRISWINPIPLTIDDDSHLMTLSFTALGMQCDSTLIQIGDIGTNQSEVIEVLTIDDENIGVETDDFTITIPGPGCLTSTADIVKPEFNLYPNPVKDILHISTTGIRGSNAVMRVYDNDGNLAKRHYLDRASKLDMTDLPAANYHYDIHQNGERIHKGKIIKI